MTPRFTAARWLPGAHLQTIYGALLARAPRVALKRERWETPDGDFVDVDILEGPHDAPWVQLFHGLEGSSRSPYARMLMAHAQRRGWRGSVMHFRGCSGEPNRLQRAYHSGDSDEADWVLRRLKERAGAAPLYAAGVSLGGNVLAKWLGERGEALGRGFGLVYTRHFLRSLKRNALARLERFPGLFDGKALRRARTLRDFDNAVTAPLHGFRDTDDYWTRASAKPWLASIRVPTLIINARDDPFMPATALPTEREVSAAVKLEFPDRGGHVGFVSGPFPGNIEWLPSRLLHFFEQRE
jgi:predicted alpha/beta-fold hydrolase